MSIRTICGGVVLSLALTSMIPGVALAAAGTRVECGQFTAWTAPDPLGPTDGSLTLAALPAWTVAATANVSAGITANLPSNLSGSPTCLQLTFDAGDVVTDLDFAASGTIGSVTTYDSGSDTYRVADRLQVPAAVVTALPGLGDLFVTSFKAHAILLLTFSVDATTGQLTGVDGRTTTCGKATLLAGGSAKVGAATLRAAILDSGDRKAIGNAGKRTTCAAVRSIGVFASGGGDPAFTTTVKVTVAAAATVTEPPTSTVDPSPVSTGDATAPIAELLVLVAAGFGGAVASAARRKRRLG